MRLETLFITGKTILPENFSWMFSEPWNGEIVYDPDLELAIDFWSKVSARYRGKNNVLYEIFNEPMWIEWEEWRLLAQELVQIIRAVASDVIIIVGGVDWAYDLRGVLSNPIRGVNIAYSVSRLS